MDVTESFFEVGFPLTGEELEILGGITALGSLLDAVSEGILSRLVSDDGWESVMVLTAGQPISWRLDRILIANENSPLGSPEIAQWVPKARAVTEKRNSLVHAAWIMRHESIGAVGHRSRRGGTTFDFRTTQDFLDVRTELRSVYDQGVELANRLHARPSGEPVE